MKGFKSGYYCWTSHGERRPTIPPMVSSNSFCGSSMAGEHNFYEEMKAELNREPTWFELYERLHRPKEKPNEWFKEEQAQINVCIC
ncbi:unnamed protein product [Trifolium pratense]|uniref:Uncharacterized protein n=1 Tax=Trifolium pratense TaxID=57577 RepID=A0ACB0MC81_TRIPR|nr:unnamed protein product [Trifolium pratense]